MKNIYILLKYFKNSFGNCFCLYLNKHKLERVEQIKNTCIIENKKISKEVSFFLEKKTKLTAFIIKVIYFNKKKYISKTFLCF